MKSFFHIPFFCVLLMSVFASGCTSSVELSTLDTQIDHLWEENLQILRRLARDVEDSGNRNKDVEVLNQSRAFLKVRKIFFSAELSDSLDLKFPINEAIVYVDSLKQIVQELNVERCGIYFDNIERMAKEELSGTAIRRRLLYLNILQIEHQILNYEAIRIGSDCWSCYRFNLSIKDDTLVVGDSITAILSMAETTLPFENYWFEDIELSKDGEKLSFSFKPIQTSGVLGFTPENAGEYTFSGVLRSTFEGVELVYSCRFSFPLVVLDTAQRSSN